MASSIGYSLGIGSGIDTKSLIADLTAAAKAPKEALIKQREERNTAQLSTLSQVAGAIDSFATALSSLVSGGTLYSQPAVSDPTMFTAKSLAGARLGGLSAEVEIKQLAKAQSLVSTPLASATAAVGQGTLTIGVGTKTFDVVIGAGNDNLDGLARAINAAKSGVTASVITEAGSARLVLRGAVGEAQAFTLSVPDGTASGLERFAYGPSVTGGMALTQAAQDAIVSLDGVDVKRPSNTIGDLIDGVEFSLLRAEPGKTVTVGVSRPTAAIEQGVNDFVAAYNELHSMLAEATKIGTPGKGDSGVLRGDLSVREMQRQLAQLTSKVLNSGGEGPRTLADIGVATNRDGTLRVDAFRLKSALETNAEGVEALFNPGQSSSSPFVSIVSKVGKVKPGTYQLTDLVPPNGATPGSGKVNGVAMIWSGSSLVAPASSPALGLTIRLAEGAPAAATIDIDFGLGGALQAVRDSLRSRTGPFTSSQERLNAEADSIADAREKMEMRSEAYYNQLVKQFGAMESRVSAFKATQSYLEQQIKMWTAGK